MTENSNFCEHCGTQLVRGANFCESCGAQVAERTAPAPRPVSVQASPLPPVPTRPSWVPAPGGQPYAVPPTAAYSPAPGYTVPTAQPAKRSSLLWIVLGAGGCLGILCIALVIAGLIFFSSENPVMDAFSDLLPTEPAQSFMQTELPKPEQPVQMVETPLPPPTQPVPTLPDPIQPEPTQPEPDPIEPTQPEEIMPTWPGDIGQEVNESYFTDDFSSTRYDWANVNDEINSFGIEDGHFALQVFQPDYTSWAYLPIDFDPTSIGFDAAIVPGNEQGAYGVMCHYQDSENYHFVSIDPMNKEYSIGYLLDDEYTGLMRDIWMPSLYLHDSPYAVNNIQITCDPDMITLFINNELEAQASTGSLTGGRMALSGETWEDMDPGGFKALFDNIYAFIQVQ
jgi:hypothetical protein